MNLFNEPSLDQLQDIVAGLNDANANAICVRHSGEVYDYEIVDDQAWQDEKINVKYYIEFEKGNRCTGPDAAKNEDQMFRLLLDISIIWLEGQTGRIQITRNLKKEINHGNS